jgi:HAMP domain-containing protein
MRSGLSRSSRRLVLPVAYASLVVSVLGYRYVQLSLEERLGDDFPLFFLLLATFSIIALVVQLALCMDRLRGLRRVETQPRPHPPERLERAVGEVLRLPDFTFLLSLALWVLITLLTHLGMWVFTTPERMLVVLRIAWPGMLFGPLTAVLVYCLVTLRVRQAVRDLEEQGLTQARIISATPRRSQIRLRLVLFTAIAVVTPAALIGDVTSSLADRAFAEVLAEPSRERQVARIETLRAEALASGGALCLLVFGVALSAAWLAGIILGRPMRQLGEAAQRIAEGDLSSPHLIPSEDEVWTVSAAFSTMRAHLADVLSQLQRAGARISSTTEGILSTSGR